MRKSGLGFTKLSFFVLGKKIKNVQSKKKFLKNLPFTKNLKIFLIFAVKMVLSTKLTH